jgi:acetolactate synthase I/II/III large subunit
MTVMTGGEAVVAALRALGVEHVFAIVSVHNLPTLDAITRDPDITLVPARHEQGAVHAADGYARATGRLGVAITSTGPGAANAVGGLFEAHFASSPVLMITGQVETPWVGRGRGALHEADQQIEMLRAVTRRAESVRNHSEIAATVVQCGLDALTGRPRPAAIEIPIDLQYRQGEVEVPPVHRDREPPAAATLERAVELLAGAERPLLWAGGGVITADAAAPFTALAEHLGAPALTSAHGRGAIPEDHPLALGATFDQATMDPMIASADVVLAVGTRFQMTGNIERAMTIPGRLIHSDVDPTVIGRNHRAEVALVGDALLTLEALAGRLAERGTPSVDPAWAEQGRAARAAVEAEIRDAMGHDLEKLMDGMRAALPRDAIVVKDSTIAAYIWANRLLSTYEPRTTIRPQSAAIGPGVPLAVGAALGTGRRTVVIQGDGGLMLSLGELAVAVQQRLPIIICVFNDQGYGILRYLQDLLLDGRRTGVDLATPDFVAMARAMGMDAEPVDSVASFEDAFGRACQADGPWLLDIDLAQFTPMEIRPQRPPRRD